MAGHSKWANIKHRKAAADAKKGKVFTRLIKEITVAAKLGGADPNMNPRLRLAMDKGREANMAKDSVQNAIKRGSGQLEGVSYEEARYEGYGPGGAAVIVDCLSDNRTRTVAEVRHAFAKNGGNLGSDGSVAFLFKHCGLFVFAPGASEEKIMDAALKPELAEVTLKPTSEAVLAGGDAQRMRSLLDALESLDDVQDVYTTAVLEDA
jgi:YebC/PmpR family DNA-binding regulatory protein